MSAAGVAVDWFGSRVLLNLFVIPVVLEAGRLGMDWISGMPASVLGEGTVAAMPAGPVRGEIGEMGREGFNQQLRST